MDSKQSLANKIHFETLAEAWRSGRELPPEVSEWSVLTWTMEFGAIDGEPVLLVLFQRGDQWQVAWPVRVHVAGRVIDRIEDYYACPWVIGNASESDLKLITGPAVLRGA